jgi:hypothetical protein
MTTFADSAPITLAKRLLAWLGSLVVLLVLAPTLLALYRRSR